MALKNPVINIDKVITKNIEEYEIIRGIVGRENRLRASKPDPKIMNGKTAYVWRYVAFFIGRKEGDSCMPVMAFCDIKTSSDAELKAARLDAVKTKRSLFGDDSPYAEILSRNTAERRQIEKDLMDLVKRIVDVVPIRDQTGTLRWGRVFGKI